MDWLKGTSSGNLFFALLQGRLSVSIQVPWAPRSLPRLLQRTWSRSKFIGKIPAVSLSCIGDTWFPKIGVLPVLTFVGLSIINHPAIGIFPHFRKLRHLSYHEESHSCRFPAWWGIPTTVQLEGILFCTSRLDWGCSHSRDSKVDKLCSKSPHFGDVHLYIGLSNIGYNPVDHGSCCIAILGVYIVFRHTQILTGAW